MFTGIVEYIGRITDVQNQADLTRFRIDLGPISDGVKLGDSVAVAGACLTVASIEEGVYVFEAIPETLAKTRLGGFAAGDAVNLERAMSSAGRFDGHMVQGHVDGVGRIRRFDRADHEALLYIECDAGLALQLVEKGSVTIDGVSLTVVEVAQDGFHVALIPYTLEVTTLSNLSVGDAVNLEVDVFGKYVKQYLDRVLPDLVASAQGARRDAAK
jgi:riboflavin synthase